MVQYETLQGIRFAAIPAGKYMMGHDYHPDPSLPDTINVYYADEQPVHEEQVKDFLLGATQITQRQYTEIMGTDANLSTFRGDDLPVTNLGPAHIREFCNKLSEKAGLNPCYVQKSGGLDPTKNGFRMPTEAEWEYACRAGSDTFFHTGNTEADLDKAGWYRGNSGGKTHPVGQKEANAWGLFDMHGNVFEFVGDDWNPNMAYSKYLPKGANPDFSYYHTLNISRGGGWFSDPSVCRSMTRSCFCNWDYIHQSYYMGCRIAKNLS